MRSDALLVGGLAVLVYGIASLSVPVAWIAGGLGLTLLGVLDGIRNAIKRGDSGPRS